MNLWGHRFSQNANQKFEGFLPYFLINFHYDYLFKFFRGHLRHLELNEVDGSKFGNLGLIFFSINSPFGKMPTYHKALLKMSASVAFLKRLQKFEKISHLFWCYWVEKAAFIPVGNPRSMGHLPSWFDLHWFHNFF